VRGLYPRTAGKNFSCVPPNEVSQLRNLTAPIFCVVFVPQIGICDVVALFVSQRCVSQLEARFDDTYSHNQENKFLSCRYAKCLGKQVREKL